MKYYYILEIFSSLKMNVKSFLLREVNTVITSIFRATHKQGSVPELKFYYILVLILLLYSLQII